MSPASGRRSAPFSGAGQRILAIALVALPVVAGYLVAAVVGGVFPFDSSDEGASPTEVMAALPPDFPVPAQGAVEFAGSGEQLPYQIVWTSARPVAELAPTYQALLRSERWELMLAEEEAPAYRVRLARLGEQGDMTHWAMLDITPAGSGSRISLEFMVTGGALSLQ